MPKGVEKDALAANGTATGQAASAYNTLNPIYSAMATNPQGLTPTQKANALTASAQGTGGGVASAVGQGGLYAARTGNAGAATAALDDASRTAGVTNSTNDLSVQNQSDAIARQQQTQGLNGLNSIYSGANSTGLGYLNTADNASQATNAATMGYVNAGLGALGVKSTGLKYGV